MVRNLAGILPRARKALEFSHGLGHGLKCSRWENMVRLFL